MMQVNFPFLQAGIEKDQIEIALEPESASLYCRSVKTCRAQEAGAGLSNFPVGTRYMVLDCGGTVLGTNHLYSLPPHPRGLAGDSWANVQNYDLLNLLNAFTVPGKFRS